MALRRPGPLTGIQGCCIYEECKGSFSDIETMYQTIRFQVGFDGENGNPPCLDCGLMKFTPINCNMICNDLFCGFVRQIRAEGFQGLESPGMHLFYFIKT